MDFGVNTIINQSKRSKTIKFLIVSIPIIVGIIMTFVWYNFHSLPGDEIYQAICVQNFKEAPLGILTFLIGKIWTDIFGFSLINLRILTLIEGILAIGVASIFCFYVTKNAILSSFAFLFGCVLIKYGGFPIYNWDSGTYLFDSLAIFILLTIINRPTGIKCFLLGISIGFITLGRLPSGIFLILAIIIIYIAYRYKKYSFNFQKVVLCILAGWIITLFLILSLAYGSPFLYFQSIADGNIVSGHSLTSDRTSLIKRLWVITLYCSQKWVPASGCMLIAVIIPKVKNKIIQLSIFIIWFVFCIIYSYSVANTEKFIPFSLGGDAPVVLGLLSFYPLYCIFTNRHSTPYVNIQLWAIVAMLLSVMFGSDAYFERASSFFLTPFLIAILWQARYSYLKKIVISVVSICTLTMGSMLLLFYYKLYRIQKVGETITLSSGPFDGIISTDEISSQELKNTEEAIPFLQKNNVKFAYAGNHGLIDLRYGRSNGISFHEFMVYLNNEYTWSKYKDSIISNVDAIVYPCHLYDSTIGFVINDLKEEGFSDVDTIGGAVIIYRDGYRKNIDSHIR